MAETEELAWVDADGGYSLAVDGSNAIVCRNAKGNTLKSVPAKVKKGDVYSSMKGLLSWLTEHDRNCRETVDEWMLRSLPIPRGLLESVWADPSWRSTLENAVCAPEGFDGSDDENIGFLRGADSERGVGIVNIDGETTWLDVGAVRLPHPIQLEYLDDFRELATDLDVTQGISQLFRETFGKPDDIAEDKRALSDFANGKFEQLNFALGRCRTLGYRVRGGFAMCPIWEGSRQVEARYWIGCDYPEYETYTGDLLWVDDKERQIPLSDVGPVAFSEGMRMAGAIYSARSKDDEQAQD